MSAGADMRTRGAHQWRGLIEEYRERLPVDDYPYVREMAPDMFACDDPEGFYEFNVHLFVAGARVTLAEQQTAQSPA